MADRERTFRRLIKPHEYREYRGQYVFNNMFRPENVM